MKQLATIVIAVFPVLWLAVGGACGGGQTGLFGTGGHTSSTSTTGTGGQCKPGGQACAAFSDCCSGTCADSVCTLCGQKGESCDHGCCMGLSCQNGTCDVPCDAAGSACTGSETCCSKVCSQGICGACGQAGAACVLAAECCSKTCSQGKCAAPACVQTGAACTATDTCCAGSCTNGTCQTQSSCAGNTTTCAAWLADASISYQDISCDAQMYADGVISCVCMYCAGACTDQATCTQEWHDNTPLSDDCHSCTDAELQSTCLGDTEACQGH